MYTLAQFLQKKMIWPLVIFLGVVTASCIAICITFFLNQDLENRRLVLERAVESLRNPIYLGSHVEIKSRLLSHNKKYPQYCLDYISNSFQTHLCSKKSAASSLFNLNKKMDFAISNDQIINLYFSWQPFFIKSFILIFFIVIILLSVGLSFFRRAKKIADLLKDEVFAIYNNSNKNNFTIMEFKNINEKFLYYVQSQKGMQESEARAKIAQQVAHDIRSPLAALKMSLKQLDDIPKEHNVMIQRSFQRINDIANNLLESSRLKISEPLKSSSFDSELIYIIVDSLISEKRLQYQQSNINIVANLDEGYNLFAAVETSSIKRVLSNLINNSVEAIKDIGKIEIKVSSLDESCLVISISDNGKGMSEKTLKKLGEKGFSYGKVVKDSGFGLGFSHAKETIESFNGNIEVRSVVGKGTIINIILPKAEPTSWFVKEIIIPANEKLFVLDDDENMFHAWSEHLPVKVLGFKNGESFSQAITEQPSRDFLVLIDYEISGQGETGLDIIKKLQIEQQSILVTSRFEDKEVLDQCRELGVPLIPKMMISLVPFKIAKTNAEEFYEYVYIEDEELLRISWESRANKKNIRLLVLSSTKEFNEHKSKISKEYTSIYIDNNLGEDVFGEKFALSLHIDGYQKLYIASGHEAEKFAHYPWLKYSGKSCPF